VCRPPGFARLLCMRIIPFRLRARAGRCAVLLLAACTRGDSPAIDGGPTIDRAIDSGPRVDSGPAVVSCSAEARPGIEVTATDTRSGAALGGFTVRLQPRMPGAGAARDSSRAAPVPPAVWHGAQERAGRFTLRVTKPGYRPWDTAEVVVTRDVCHVRTVRLTVPLEPL
jgi:hypothetical protein